jgi:hypothetical protein
MLQTVSFSMEGTKKLICSLAGTTPDSEVDVPSYRQARTLRNLPESDLADALPKLAPDDRRPHRLFIHVARRLCGNQEDGNLPPFHALDNEPVVSGSTPAEVAAAWTNRWAEDPDAKPLERPELRILHKGLTRRKLLARDALGRTLVHIICLRGCVGVFSDLLQPEDLTITSDGGHTPLSQYIGLIEQIPPSFWRPECMSMTAFPDENVTFRDLLIEKHRDYVEGNFDEFHPEVKAILLADILAA